MQNFNALGNIQFGKGYVLFSINPEIYSLGVVKKSALEYIQKACVILDGDPKSEILVELRSEQDLKKIAEEFSKILIKNAN
jgi:hypothetical protein